MFVLDDARARLNQLFTLLHLTESKGWMFVLDDALARLNQSFIVLHLMLSTAWMFVLDDALAKTCYLMKHMLYALSPRSLQDVRQ